MLPNNIMPLPKRGVTNSNGEEGTLEHAALNALSGLFCSVCDAPLSKTDRMTDADILPYTAYVCCHMSHCPYCGFTGEQGCPHLVACRVQNNWLVAGLPDLAGQPVPPPLPLSKEYLLDYSDVQKREAFGDASDLLFPLYGPGFREVREPVISGYLLVDTLVRPENRQSSRDDTEHCFSRDAFARAEVVRRAPADDLPHGFARLGRMQGPGSEFVLRTLETENDIGALAWAPCGTRFAVCDFATVSVWSIEVQGDRIDNLHRQLQWTKPSRLGRRQYKWVAFSPDGACIMLQHQRPGDSTDYEIEFVDAKSGEWISGTGLYFTDPFDSPLPEEMDEPRETFDATREAFLHGGAIFLTVRGRCLRFYRMDSLGEPAEPCRTVVLRQPVNRIAMSPDNETFLTAVGKLVTIWRVPQEAVRRKKGSE